MTAYDASPTDQQYNTAPPLLPLPGSASSPGQIKGRVRTVTVHAMTGVHMQSENDHDIESRREHTIESHRPGYSCSAVA